MLEPSLSIPLLLAMPTRVSRCPTSHCSNPTSIIVAAWLRVSAFSTVVGCLLCSETLLLLCTNPACPRRFTPSLAFQLSTLLLLANTTTSKTSKSLDLATQPRTPQPPRAATSAVQPPYGSTLSGSTPCSLSASLFQPRLLSAQQIYCPLVRRLDTSATGSHRCSSPSLLSVRLSDPNTARHLPLVYHCEDKSSRLSRGQPPL